MKASVRKIAQGGRGAAAQRVAARRGRAVRKKRDALITVKASKGARSSPMIQLRQVKRTQLTVERALAKLARQSVAASGPLLAGLQKAWRDIEVAVRQAIKRVRETR
jgi:isocitrate dehydrogenase